MEKMRGGRSVCRERLLAQVGGAENGRGGQGRLPWFSGFSKGRGWRLFCRDGFRFRFSFLVFPPGLSKLPLLVCVGLVVFIGEVWLGPQTWSLNFSFLFANLIFLVFCIFFKNEQYQYQLNEESQ